MKPVVDLFTPPETEQWTVTHWLVYSVILFVGFGILRMLGGMAGTIVHNLITGQ